MGCMCIMVVCGWEEDRWVVGVVGDELDEEWV